MIDTSQTYTFEHLRNWNVSEPLLAVIGHPIDHSLSPLIHNAALKHLAPIYPHLKNISYIRFDIEPSKLFKAIHSIHKLQFLGLNITAPHKVSILEYVTAQDTSAIKCGSCNTLVLQASGYKAYTTDAYGLCTALKYHMGRSLSDFNCVCIFGAGGAARSAIDACIAAGCKSILITNRSCERLQNIQHWIDTNTVNHESCVQLYVLSEFPNTLPSNTLVINATSAQTVWPLVDLNMFSDDCHYFDMNYGTQRSTFLRYADSIKAPAIDGISMLVFQAAYSLSLWTGVPINKIPTELMTTVAQNYIQKNAY